VTEGDLFPGGIVSFGVSSGSGSVAVNHVNAGAGLQSLTVVSATNVTTTGINATLAETGYFSFRTHLFLNFNYSA